MNYIQLLRRIHQSRGRIDQYLEIGCRTGRSLGLSRAKDSVAVDPQFNISHPLVSPTRLYKMTSDAFFDTEAAKALKAPIDLTFIDGMHLAEFALRDFINVEKFSRSDGWIVLDDVLPEEVGIASRTRTTSRWTGDIYKLTDVLRRYRPDLEVTVFDVEMKGLMLVRGLNPQSDVLDEAYPEIEADLMRDDAPTLTVEEIRTIARPVAPEAFCGQWLAENPVARAPSDIIVDDALILTKPLPMRHHGVFHADGSPCQASAIHQGLMQVTGFATSDLPVAPDRLDGDHLYGGLVADHFGHILLETFSRLWLFEASDLPVIFTVANPSRMDLFWALVDGMGLPRDRIVLADRPIRVERLHVVPAGFVIRDRIEPAFVNAYAAVGTEIAARTGVTQNSNSVPAYLSRSKTPRGGRYYFGEALIEGILARNGVDIIHLEDHGIADQIRTWLTRERVGGFAGSAFHMLMFATAPKRLTYFTTHIFNRNFRLIERLKSNTHEVCRLEVNPISDATRKSGPFLLSRQAIVEACRAMGVVAGPEDVPEPDYAACVTAYQAAVAGAGA